VCPEIEVGLGVPRPTLRLFKKRDIEDLCIVQSKDKNVDYTNSMDIFSREKVIEYKLIQIDGCILKSKSPSCGMNVKVYNEKGNVVSKNDGIFANRIKTLWPELPVIEDGKLHNPRLREQFKTKVLLHNEWNNKESLLKFHLKNKYYVKLFASCIIKELRYLISKNDSDSYYKTFFQRLRDQVVSIKSEIHIYQQVFHKLYKNNPTIINISDSIEFTNHCENVKSNKTDIQVARYFLKHYIRKTDDIYIKDKLTYIIN